jgi:hypothetical protein
VAIGGYFINDYFDYSVISHWWLFYWWLLMAILLMVINGYCIIINFFILSYYTHDKIIYNNIK